MTPWIRCHPNPGLTSLDAMIELQRNRALAWWVEPGCVLVAWPVGSVGWFHVEAESTLRAVTEAREGRGKPLAFPESEATTMLEVLLRESIERARANPAGGGR